MSGSAVIGFEVHAILFTHLTFEAAPKFFLKHNVLNILVLSFMEPVYYDPTDYFDITQHEVDRQDELEYEVRGCSLV